jgi:hypothetical protein
MTPIYHSKFHGKNHHTIATDTEKYPDAGKDPIASPEHPFYGDFVCGDALHASDDNLAGNFKNDNTALLISSTNNSVCLSTVSDTVFYNNITAETLSFAEKGMYPIDFVHTNSSETGTFWVMYLSGTMYGVRLWDTEQVVELNIEAPSIVPNNSAIKIVPQDFVELISFNVYGTEPIKKQWYLNNKPLVDQDRSFIRTNIVGDYMLVASNLKGSVSSEVFTLSTEPIQPSCDC